MEWKKRKEKPVGKIIETFEPLEILDFIYTR